MRFWMLIVIALVVSSIGFKKYVWFISLGYGFSVAALGCAMLFSFRASLDPLSAFLCLALVFYGLRLGMYLAIREKRSSTYGKALQKDTKSNDDVSVSVRFAIWITCAILYAVMVAPVFFRLENGAGPQVLGWIGLVFSVCGILLEIFADFQKQKAKKTNPHRFVNTGVYRLVRCPNYLGELVNWTGMLISGLAVFSGPVQWIAALIGWLGIVYVMFSGARRLEVRQNRNYGDDSEYQQYVKTTPILLPFVPLYSVEKYTWLVA